MTNFAEKVNIGGLCSRLNYQLSSVQEQPVKSKRENSNLSVFLEIKAQLCYFVNFNIFYCVTDLCHQASYNQVGCDGARLVLGQ